MAFVCFASGPAGEGETSRGLQAGPGRLRVRREDPEHRLQPHEREAGGALGSGESLHNLHNTSKHKTHFFTPEAQTKRSTSL